MTQLSSSEADGVRRASHSPPCPWTLGSYAALTLLLTVGGTTAGLLVSDYRETRGKVDVNCGRLSAVETDIRYIRESVERIESAVSRPRASAPSPAITPGAVAALPEGVTIP